jgi:hypothetical protein
MFQKLMYYGAIIGLAPQELRWTATESALSLIENSSLENDDPAYNLFQVHVLRQNVTNQVSGDGFAVLNGRHFTKRMINSKSPALHLFGLLDEAKLNPFQLDSNSR